MTTVSSQAAKRSLANVLQLTLEELKAELVNLCVSTDGRKPDLQVKLCKALAIEVNSDEIQSETFVNLASLDSMKPIIAANNSGANSPAGSSSPSHCSVGSRESGKSRLNVDQLFELEKMRLHLDQQTSMRKLEMDLRKQEFDLERMKLEQNHVLEMAKIAHVADTNASTPFRPNVNQTFGVATDSGFHASKYRIDLLTKMVPKFDPSDVDLFFISFERALTINKVPTEYWPAVLNAIVFGKAQRVLTSLSLEELLDYQLVKTTLLSAFDVCAEVFRKRFRGITKGNNDSFAEFSFKLKETFDRWLSKSEITDLESLKQLILLERFNEACADDSDLAMWLLNKSPKKLSEAAHLADEFTAMRRANKATAKRLNFSNYTRTPNSQASGVLESQTPVLQNASNLSCETYSKEPVQKNSSVSYGSYKMKAPPAATIRCGYCKKLGHEISECFSLKRKNSEHKTGNNRADTCLVSTRNFDNYLRDTVDHRFREHCFQAIIVKPDKTEQLVTCLRDTAALQSLIREFKPDHGIDKNVESYITTPESRQICGIGGVRISVPLVQVDIKSDRVRGLFEFGVCNNLPLGIDLLAGNDLFNSDVTDTCVVTRSKTAVERAAIPASTMNSSTNDSNNLISTLEGTGNSADDSDDSDLHLSWLFNETSSNSVPISSIVNRETLISLQQADITLNKYMLKAQASTDVNGDERFFFKSGVLMRNWCHRSQPADTGNNQIVAPASIRHQLLYISHDIPASGHLGMRKTLDRLIRHFWWGSIQTDVREYVRSCHKCQCLGKGKAKIIAPLYSMPLVSEPWSICAIDIVGPLPTCKETGNRFILTVLDLCTHYPEAIALKQHTAKDVALALANVFSRVGFPDQILSDLGTEMTSEVLQIFLNEFNIGHLRCAAYHPMSNGAVEKYNACLKASLKTLTDRFPDSWDNALCWVLFGYREVVNETTGFSPFELLFGRSVKGPLTLIKQAMLQETDLSRSKKSVVEFMLETRERLRTGLDLATAHAQEQRSKAKVWYDRKARMQEFKPGDKVLMLWPMHHSPLDLKLFGPYVVAQRLGPVDYVINTPNRKKSRRVCHVNLLRPYRERDLTLFPEVNSVNVVFNSDFEVVLQSVTDRVSDGSKGTVNDLTIQQQNELITVLEEFRGVFSDKPGRTTLCEHHIELSPGAKPVFCRPYRLPPDKLTALKDEISSLLEQGIIEEAPSNGTTWASPVIMVPKVGTGELGTPTKSWRLCADMRMVNSRTEVDPFPLPRIEELIDRVGSAKYLTKLDMVKGYWQVPLDSESIPVSGFVTSFGHFRWRFMPFGCRNAPATFSRLVRNLLSGLEMFCAAYLDDIIIFSSSWADHKRHIAEVLRRIRNAGLTLNLSKCVFAVAELDYLGHQIGCNRVQPREQKIAALLQYGRPVDRKSLQSFLGLAGYYRRFLPNFSHMSAVLSNLLKKNVKFEWTDEAETAFVDLKSRLATRPILRPPDWSKPFCLAVDSSNIAVGGNLFQIIDGVEHPICFFSKKLDVHQQNYSTIEKEALGLILAVRAFSIYFGSSRVRVFTDHNPLVFLKKMCNHNQRLLRWSLELQEYCLDIEHRAGKDNLMPDLLSRSF